MAIEVRTWANFENLKAWIMGEYLMSGMSGMSGMMRVGVFNYDFFEIHFFSINYTILYIYIYIYNHICIYNMFEWFDILWISAWVDLFSLGRPGAGGDRRLGNGERYALAVRGGCKDSRWSWLRLVGKNIKMFHIYIYIWEYNYIII